MQRPRKALGAACGVALSHVSHGWQWSLDLVLERGWHQKLQELSSGMNVWDSGPKHAVFLWPRDGECSGTGEGAAVWGCGGGT